MRPKKDRGIRIDNGEWVKGSLIIHNAYDLKDTTHAGPLKAFIQEQDITWNYQEKCWNFLIYEVIPETVGQFTGLCDKNGKDLDWWEGDVFKMHGHSTPWVIVKEKGCFWFKCPLTKEWVLCYRAAEYFHLPEKIGNIHENPELLEQAK